MHSHRAPLAVAVDQRVLIPTLLVRTYAATAYHRTHFSATIDEAVKPDDRLRGSKNSNLGRGDVHCKHNGVHIFAATPLQAHTNSRVNNKTAKL